MFILPFLLLAALNILCVYVSKRRFGTALPVTLLISVFVLFFSQYLFHTFAIGMYILYIAAAAGIVLVAAKHNDREYISRICSIGLFSFMAIYLIFIVTDFGRHFTAWDEISHWGMMAKEMLRTDRFYSDASSKLTVHRDYPPFMTIFEYLVCRLSGGYSEGAVTFALHLISFSMLVSPVSEYIGEGERGYKWYKKLFVSALLVLIMELVLISFDADNVYSTIYTDLFMAILYVYAVWLILSKDATDTGFGYFSFVLTLCALILSKQMSAAFVMLAWLLFIVMYALGKRGNVIVKGIALKALGMILLPAFCYLLWNIYVKSNGITGQFELSQISARGVLSILAGGGIWAQHAAYFKYVEYLFSYPITTGVFKLSFMTALIVALVLLYIIYALYKDIWEIKNAVVLGVASIIGAIGYAFTMFVLYMFCFSEGEMSGLASFGRYMDSYAVSMYLILFVLLIQLGAESKTRRINCAGLCIAFAVLLLIADNSRLTDIAPQIFKGNGLREYEELAAELDSHIDAGTKVLIVSSNNQMYGNFMRYMTEKPVIDANEEIWADFDAAIADNDYIYVIDTNDTIEGIVSEYTHDPVQAKTIYRVTRDGGKTGLERME